MKRISMAMALLASLCAAGQATGQDSVLAQMMAGMDSVAPAAASPAPAAFQGTRVINGHSVETTPAQVLDFRVHHRFGFINSGAYNFFGLDNATTRISLDYGLNSRLSLGIGRSTFLKQMDGFVKYRVLRQQTGGNMPVSLTLLAATALRTQRPPAGAPKFTTVERMAHTVQALLAKRWKAGHSLQLMPTLVHYNLVRRAADANTRFSLGAAGRLKVSRRISLTAEYYQPFEKFPGTVPPLALGVDIETGGHVFQLHLTNGTGMTEPTFIHETTGRWDKGDIHFGFNISRSFSLRKRRN